jgi:hypothetical protein
MSKPMRYLATITKPNGYLWSQQGYNSVAEASMAVFGFFHDLAGPEGWKITIIATPDAVLGEGPSE